MKQVLIIDNYDSFTYNLVHYLEALDVVVTTVRNDEVHLNETLNYDAIVLSPGPGIPSEAGDLMATIDFLKDKKPLLGICLGLQAIVESHGGVIKNLNQVYHGISTPVTHDNDVLFKNIDTVFEVGHYHSWVADTDHFPDDLQITATDQQGHIMAIKHKELPIYAVQFHPESIMTPQGKKILSNFVNII